LTKEIILETTASQVQSEATGFQSQNELGTQARERVLEDALPQQNTKATSAKANGDCAQSCGNCSSCACGSGSCGSCSSCASCGCDCAENLK